MQLSPDVRDLVERLAAAPAGPALLLDFDGTLADIVATPPAARLHPACAGPLERLLAQDVPVGIVSGRASDDLQARFPLDGAWLSGVHGAELVAPAGARMAAHATPEARAALDAFVGHARGLEPIGVRLEDKRLAVAAHVRGIEPAERQRAARERLIAAAQAVVAERAGEVSWLEGKAVIEVRSRQASKANAARMLARRWPAGAHLVAIGDDTTDEEMFVETLRAGGVAVKVGEGPTAASHRLADPAAVGAFLEALADALASARGDGRREGRGPRRG
jgi:trehalose-phosphatase